MVALWVLAGGVAGALVGALVAARGFRMRLAAREAQAIDAERRAQQAERLAELGSMTSGLAHEIKNPLSTVVLNAQLVSEEISDSELNGVALIDLKALRIVHHDRTLVGGTAIEGWDGPACVRIARGRDGEVRQRVWLWSGAGRWQRAAERPAACVPGR